jgi:hypothetical protein
MSDARSRCANTDGQMGGKERAVEVQGLSAARTTPATTTIFDARLNEEQKLFDGRRI